MDAKGGNRASTAHAEIELKLTADPKALAALRDAPAVIQRARGRGVNKRLESIYYDTPDYRLHKRNLAFRVRRAGGQFVQTLKDEGQGDGRLRRGEWESEVASMAPDLAALPAPEPREKVGLILPGELRPVFASQIQRTTRVLDACDADGGQSEIEIAFDDGVVKTATDAVPVAEVELELRSGSPAALYQLALELHGIAPLRVETRSKSARGYALARGGPPLWHKAEKLTLDPAATVDGALSAIVRNCQEHWLANEAAALDGGDPEGVHQMRIALRRLRSAMSLFAKAIPPDQRSWLKTDSGWVAGNLGPARDWDVFLGSVLQPLLQARPDDAALVALRRAAAAERAAGYLRAGEAIGSPRYTRFLLRLGAWLEGSGWRGDFHQAAWQHRPMVALADRLLRQRHRTVLRLAGDFAVAPIEQRHRVRIALKKLRYASEFFRTLYPAKRVKPYLKSLAGLQDSIGYFNDVAVAARLLADIVARPAAAHGEDDRIAVAQAAGTVIGWHEHGIATNEPQLVADWTEFAAARPFWHKT
ncbi:MAG: CHAD domain-containing protein [Alphaproteobacteria bacterium]